MTTVVAGLGIAISTFVLGETGVAVQRALSGTVASVKVGVLHHDSSPDCHHARLGVRTRGLEPFQRREGSGCLRRASVPLVEEAE